MNRGKMAGPRALLRRLREVMASGGTPQDRLDAVTTLIATNMVAEVCSLYLRRAGDVLELFSTYGLRPEAVHQTRLRVGEGLIGDIVAHGRMLALPDAQSHPQFAYRPETGEERFHSLLGVPLQRGGRAIGALAVQNRSEREYTAEESEALQTVAMVLAELVHAAGLLSVDEVIDIDGNATLPLRFEGMPLASGIAEGHVYRHRGAMVVRELVSDDTAAESARLERAIEGFLERIRGLVADHAPRIGEAEKEVLHTYRMFAEDEGWMTRMRAAVRDGLTAEGAVRRVQDENRRRLQLAPGPYFRERIADFDDLSNQLLRQLANRPEIGATDMPANAVLVARTLGPAELLEYDPDRLKAIVLGEGSPTSHMVLVARSLNIPVVGRLASVLGRLDAGEAVVVDGWRGLVYARPDESVYDDIREYGESEERRRRYYESMRNLPAHSADGVSFQLHLNVGLLGELPLLAATGASGIGLLRTELLFLTHPTFPSIEEQTAAYRHVFDAAGEKPVIFRTFDLGGDKVLPHLDQPLELEENPAMGWRAIRVGLDRPSVLRNQLRALLTAAEGRPLQVMFPMVAEFAELARAQAILDLEVVRARRVSLPVPEKVSVGVMLEVPSLVWQLEEVVRVADFVSVGTNDLAQYFFANDRTNPRLARRYDTLSPGFLRLLAQVEAICRRAGKPLTVCGDMAANPLEAACLAGLGYRSLSIPAQAFGGVKAGLRSLDCAAISTYLADLEVRGAGRGHSLREDLKHFVQDHGFKF